MTRPSNANFESNAIRGDHLFKHHLSTQALIFNHLSAMPSLAFLSPSISRPPRLAPRPLLSPRRPSYHHARRRSVMTQADNASHSSAPCPETTSPPMAPVTMLDTRVVIVGAGPVGLCAALLLHQRGLRVILLERAPPDMPVDPTRSYNIFIFNRSRRVLRLIPGLLPAIQSISLRAPDISVRFIDVNGTVSPAMGGIGADANADPDLITRRHTLVKALTNAAVQCAGIDIVSGVEVTDVTLRGDGKTEIVYQSEDGTTHHVVTSLVLGCDGRRSAVSAAIAASTGKAEKARDSGSSDVHLKGMCVSPDMPTVACGQTVIGDPERTTIVLRGKHFSGRSPAPPPGTGRQLVFSLPRGHALWDVEDGTALRKLFDENFPNVNLHAAIGDEAFEEFATRPARRFGPVRRAQVQATRVGDEGNGGVVLLGDAAHSFPPDLGQGLNSGIEGVGVLATVLDGGGEEMTAGDVAQRYAELREKDVEGLMYCMMHGAPFQYGQIRVAKMYMFLKSTVLRLLARWFPRVLYPAVSTMIFRDITYAEVKRRSQVTSMRILAAAWAMLALIRFLVRKVALGR